jgi:hypothetical protein
MIDQTKPSDSELVSALPEDLRDAKTSIVNLSTGGVPEAVGGDTTGILYDLPTYANNTAAKAGGLVAGQLYSTGADPDVVCIVH